MGRGGARLNTHIFPTITFNIGDYPMSASLLFKPVINAVLPSNEIAASAELYSYKAGSTALYPLYLDEDNITAATNPVIANASGEFPPLFTDDGQDYKLILREAGDPGAPGTPGAILWEIDNYGRIGRTNEIVSGSRIEDFYGLDASIAPNLTVIVPIASDEILKNPQEGVDAVESWKIPPSSKVILQLKDETIVHPARIAAYAMQSSDQVKLQGIAPLSKNIASSGHSLSGATGDYSVTFKLDDVNDVKVGHFVNILDNNEFQRTASKKTYVEYDQSRPRWVFTEIQAITPDSGTVPEGFVEVIGTTCTLLRRFTNDDGDTEYEPTILVDASTYITAGEVFFVNGQMREIVSVPATGPTFELESALEADLPPQTYWYTLINKIGRFTQSGTTITAENEVVLVDGVETNVLPDFNEYQVGDFVAYDGVFNPIRSIATDGLSMTVVVPKTVSTSAKFSIVRSEGAFAGLHPITAVDADNSTITFYLRAFYLESQMAIPIKGITGGVIKIVRSVLETTGAIGGITVDGRNFTYGDLVIKGPVFTAIPDPAGGNGIDAKGQSGFNAGRVTFEGTGGTYGFNIGVDFGVGCVGKVQEQINFASKFAGMRCDNSIVEADFAICGGSNLYGVITNNSNTNFNFARQNGNKTQGYLAATPCNTVADSMRQIGNRARSVVIQAGSFHLVQFESLHCGQGPQLVNSNGRITGARIFGGKRPFIVTGGSVESSASTFSGFEGNGILLVGGIVKLLRAVVVGSGPSVVGGPTQGAALTASNGARVDITDSFIKNVGGFIVTQDSYVEVSRSNIEPSISLSAGGTVDALNMTGTLTSNLTPNTVDTTTGSVLRT